MGWGRKNQRRGQPGNAGQFASDMRGATRVPTTSSTLPPPTEQSNDSDLRWVPVRGAQFRERAATKALATALATRPSPEYGDEHQARLISDARKVITSPDQYPIEFRREISNLVTDLELARGEHIAARVAAYGTEDARGADEESLRSARAIARAACMTHADRARNALDTLEVGWGAEVDDDTLIRNAEEILSKRDAADAWIYNPNPGEGELWNAITNYRRNEKVAHTAEQHLPRRSSGDTAKAGGL